MPHLQSRSVTGGSVSSLALAYSSNTTAGSLLVAAASAGSGITSLSDSQGNTWSSVTGQTGDPAAELRYSPNCPGGACTVTATWTNAFQLPALSIAEYSGLAASSPLDNQATATGFGTAASTAGVATTQADELLICVTSRNNANSPATISPGTHFTERTDTNSARGHQLADRFVASTGTYAGAATLDSNSAWGQVFATFKGASGHPTIRRFGACEFARHKPIGIPGVKVF